VKLSGEFVKRFLDITYPDVGQCCPYFSVMVVVFAAALTRNASPAFLQKTGYRREYVDAIAANMTNNGLWKSNRCKDTLWFQEVFRVIASTTRNLTDNVTLQWEIPGTQKKPAVGQHLT
jgi:hypothetical protein